jgi:hypothetical protein
MLVVEACGHLCETMTDLFGGLRQLRRSCLIFLITYGIGFPNLVTLNAQSTRDVEPTGAPGPLSPDEEHVEIPVSIVLEYRSDQGGYFLAPIEVEALEGGKKYKLNITAENPTDQVISFSRINVECACAKFESPANVVLPHGFASFSMYLDTPMVGGVGEARTGAKFIDAESGRVVMRLSLRYRVNKVFSLPTRRLNIELPDGKREVTQRVPVTLVPPLTLQDLELEIGHSLRDLSATLVELDNVPYVEIIVLRESVPTTGMIGELLLRRKGTTQPFGLLVEVKRQEKFSLSPESLRFTPVANDPGRMEAFAVLCVQIPESETAEKAGSENDRQPTRELLLVSPEVSVKVGQRFANVSLRPLGRSGVYRVRVSVEADATDGEKSEVTWLLRCGKEERKMESNAFFSK